MPPRGLCVLILVVGCYQQPSASEPCAITCSTDCPDGLTCERGFCIEPGQVCRPEFVRVAAGTGFACGIDSDAALWCWGSNVHHQISPSSQLQYPRATRISRQAWDSVDAGGEHVCGISAGQLLCWGNNDHGQVSLNIVGDVDVPFAIVVPEVSAWTQVSVGFSYTCAIGDRKLYCWGINAVGQLGNGAALGADSGPAAVMSTVTDWIAVAAGNSHTCAISESTGVYCWGLNNAGEIGPKGPALSASQFTPIDVPLAAGPLLATAVAVTRGASCAATVTGALYCWGTNADGELGDPKFLTTNPLSSPAPIQGSDLIGWTELAGSEYLVCGLAGGAVYCWGYAISGGLGAGVWSDDKAFAKVTTASHIDVGWSYELDPTSGYDTGSRDLACAVVGGDILCWGDNRYGQLGRGAATMAPSPTEVVGGHLFSTLRIGRDHACGIDEASLYCWGSTVNGQTIGLVSGSTVPRVPCVAALDCDVGVPKEILFAANPGSVAVGAAHTCALHNQVMTCWGDNSAGQLGSTALGASRRDVGGPGGLPWQSLIPGGGLGQCATQLPGETWCWGTVIAAQPAKMREAQLDGVKAIAQGLDFACIVDRTGRLRCLGNNANGQFGNGVGPAMCPNMVCDAGETAAVASCQADCCPPTGICGVPALAVLPRTYDAIAASPNGQTACGLLPTGRIECWGGNARGQTGSPDVVADTTTPFVVPDLTSCTAISLALDHSCAICDGTIACWGDNQFGGLGAGDLTPDPVLTPRRIALVLPDDPWIELGSGAGFSCARSTAGHVYCWGAAPHAGLGNGAMSANLPVTVLASPAL